VKDINRNIKKSIYWNYTSSVIIHSVALVTSAILLKYLSPIDFGILATLFLLLGIGSIFIGQGYISAIIREKNINNIILSTVFWINVGFGLLVVLLSYLLGDLLGLYFEIDHMREYLSFFSLAYLLQAINVVPLALLQRNLDFRLHSIIHIWATIVAAILAITLAMTDYGVYSLLWRGLSAGVVVTLYVWYKSDWKPQFAFDYGSLDGMHNFSRGVLGTEILRYGANQLDNLLVIKLLGTADLGIYNRAKTFVQKPAREIHIKTTSVAYAALSKLEDPTEYRNTLFKFTLLLSMVIIPIALIVMISSDTLIHKYLNKEWYPMINILKVLGVAAITISTSMPSQILLSKGKSGLLFKTELLSNAIKISALLLAFKYTDLMTIVCLFLFGQFVGNLIQNIAAYRSVEGYKTMIWKYHILPVLVAFTVLGLAIVIDFHVTESLVSLTAKLIICLTIFGLFARRMYPDIINKLTINDN